MMHDCADGEMRDLLPGYVHGTLSAAERAAVAAHLELCAECTEEVELITTASRAMRAPTIDIGRIMRALPHAPRGSSQILFAGRAWRIAAAIGVIVIGAFSVVALRGLFGAAPIQTASAPPAAPRAAPPAAPTASSPLAASSPASSAAVPDSSAGVHSPAVSSRQRTGISFGGGMSDLTDDQLNTLLGELDALQSLPSTEPETHLSPIVPMADGGHNAR